MIGGIDIQIPLRPGTPALEVAVRAVRQAWQHAVFENALVGERYNTFSEIPFGTLEEMFVYRQAEDADRWDAEHVIVHCPIDLHVVVPVISTGDADERVIARAVRIQVHIRRCARQVENASLNGR